VKPYWSDGQVSLYLGDCREVLPALGLTADLILTDCPYGETSLGWDRWVDGWPTLAATAASSMWAFGSMRMFGEHWGEFTAAGWRMSQDVIGSDEDGDPVFGDVHVVWEKPVGTSLAADRFRRVHEHALHWYQGAPWSETRHETPREAWHGADNGRRSKGGSKGAHLGEARNRKYVDEGTRLMRSVIRVANLRQRAIAPTQKPVGILQPLIEYACPSGGVVLDLFGGSASTAEAARGCGRRAVVIEADEAQIEKAAKRLSQGVLQLGDAA
jgi:site-specific DNA-methyltransferase (adenine-specific)